MQKLMPEKSLKIWHKKVYINSYLVYNGYIK